MLDCRAVLLTDSCSPFDVITACTENNIVFQVLKPLCVGHDTSEVVIVNNPFGQPANIPGWGKLVDVLGDIKIELRKEAYTFTYVYGNCHVLKFSKKDLVVFKLMMETSGRV